MRIVGGKYKGRRFNPGKTFRSRPTTDFSKESLFNILENTVSWHETATLDLFAGTGSISFELVSRGCKSVCAVERDPYHCRFIREVAEELQLAGFTLVRDDVFRFISRTNEKYQLIFADPPYDMPDFSLVAERIFESGLLAPGGLFILEHSKYYNFSHFTGFSDARSYGSVWFSFFRNPDGFKELRLNTDNESP